MRFIVFLPHGQLSATIIYVLDTISAMHCSYDLSFHVVQFSDGRDDGYPERNICKESD